MSYSREDKMETAAWEAVKRPAVRVCDVCGNPITREQGYIHHQRLDANVHLGCPRTAVKGEDITMHAVFWCNVPVVGDDV